MKPRKTTYLLHRWVGLIVSLQLLAWSVGGLMFSILEIDVVRGERDAIAIPFEPFSTEAFAHLPEFVGAEVLRLSETHPGLSEISLRDRGLGFFWEVHDADGVLIARLSPTDGAVTAMLTEQEASRLAQRDFAHEAGVVKAVLIESDPPIEYRKGALPVYAVTLDHPQKPNVYIDAQTGRVNARRNKTWRIFDFFWMLHTMDYTGRDDFNHPLLTAFSVLAITTSATGVSLWGWRFCSRLRKPRRIATGASS